MIRATVLTAGAASMLALAALFVAHPGGATASEESVDVGNFYFCDSSFENGVCQTTVTAGDIVTWTVSTGFHTVTQCEDETYSGCPPSGGFDSGQLTAGEEYQRTFLSPGTFYYLCNNHPGPMRGVITVVAQETPTPSPTASPTAGPTQSPESSPTPVPNETATPATVPDTGAEPGASSPDGFALAIAGAAAVAIAIAGFATLRSLRSAEE